MTYVGRFAPSPTGPLHAGSLVAALASWLDARAAHGRWLVRIEDLDAPRCVAGCDALILGQLARCGLVPDAAPVWQSRRTAGYQAAADRLDRDGLLFRCTCSRSAIQAHWLAQGRVKARHTEWPYPGTCRDRSDIDPAMRHALRLRTGVPGQPLRIDWRDRRLGAQSQDVAASVGDVLLRRSDGCWSYQLAVVVDDADQGVSHIVRGEDLADNTARQIVLQRALGLPTPHYLHAPLVLARDGQKLSKQNGAAPLQLDSPLQALSEAGRALGLSVQAQGLGEWLRQAVSAWRAAHPAGLEAP